MLKSNRNGRYWESSNQIQPPLLEENTNKFSFPPCSHSHCSQAISFFPLPGLQPTWYFPSKYIAFVSSIYPPNVNLASLEEMEGESKSLRNRRHQENMKPNLHIQCQTWMEIMLSFMFLSLVLLETFLPFPGSPSRPQLELQPILLGSRTHTYIEL